LKDSLIVFDTNSYRNFVLNQNTKSILDEKSVRRKIQDLVDKESKKGIQACLAPIVVMELFSHLAKTCDPHYEHCKMALLAANIHCQDVNCRPRILMDAEIQLCNLLFDEIPQDKFYEIQIKICEMTVELHKDPSEKNMDKWRNNFQSIEENIKGKEEDFLKSIKRNVFNDIYANDRKEEEQKSYKKDLYMKINNGDLIDITANSQLERICERLCKRIESHSEDERNQLINIIKENFQVPLKFYENFIKSILDSDGDYNLEDESKGNYFWDFNLLFYIGDFRVQSKEIKLITNDKNMHKSAKQLGYQNKIMSLQNYLQSVLYYI